MAQGKFKLPNKKKKNEKGKSATQRSNRPIQSKKAKVDEAQKLKKIISKNVNKAVEDEIRSRATGEKPNFSKAQQMVAAHNKATTSAPKK